MCMCGWWLIGIFSPLFFFFVGGWGGVGASSDG